METKVTECFSEQSGTKIILFPKYNHYKQNWHFFKKKGIQFVFTNVGLKLTSKIPVSQSASRPVSQSDEKKRDVIRYRNVESDGSREGGWRGCSKCPGRPPFIFFLLKKIGFAPWPDIMLSQTFLKRNLPFDYDVRQWSHPLMIMNLLVTCNSHTWIMFSFNWLVVIGEEVYWKLDVQGLGGRKSLDVDG